MKPDDRNPYTWYMKQILTSWFWKNETKNLLFALFRHFWGEPRSGSIMNENITQQINYGLIPTFQNH